MSDWVFIKYNGIDAFSPQPTPFIGLDDQTIYINEIWGRVENITLQGQITGCTYNDLVTAQGNLVNNFSKSYQTLEVYQQTGNIAIKVFEKQLVEINSIDFAQTKWMGVIPYTINLKCYPSGLFSGAYGILNPVDNWSFDEQRNASLDITHTLSCQPFNTSSGPSNALDNARNWAFGKTGLNSAIAPIMISGVGINDFCLLTQQETIDRFNGTYSLIENYTNDLARSGYGVVRYTTEINSGNGIITVNLNGSAQGGNRNITGLRYAVGILDKTAIAANAYQSVFNKTDLNPIPLTQSIEENPFDTTINFSYSFDNSNLPSTWFDYQVNCAVGTNGFINTSIQGTVYSRGGDTASKLARSKAYASGVNLYELALPFYNNFDVSSSVVPLNPVATQLVQTNNETDGTVTLSASYNNTLQGNDALERFECTFNVNPAKPQIDAQPILDRNGTYSVVNLNYRTRTSISMQGNAVTKRNYPAAAGLSAVQQYAYQLLNQYFGTAVLTQSILTSSRTDERLVSFDFEWTSAGNGGINLS